MGKPNVSKNKIRAQIARQRERVLDLDIDVDTKRGIVDVAVGDLRAAVNERDRAAAHLAALCEWSGDETLECMGVSGVADALMSVEAQLG